MTTEKIEIFEPLCCTPKALPPEHRLEAALCAIKICPMNHAPVARLVGVIPDFVATPDHLALLTTKYWGPAGVSLTVGFLDGPGVDLQKRILGHMNAWGRSANVVFRIARTDPQVRIARLPGQGLWSYLGTDVLSIRSPNPTMNLQGFTMGTPDSEFFRVVRHETGHTLGFPHEHMRAELVARIVRPAAIRFYGATQGWSPQQTDAQVLTPIDARKLLATPRADPDSVMCYQIPGSITVDRKPILGGTDINERDHEFAGSVYPKKRAR